MKKNFSIAVAAFAALVVCHGYTADSSSSTIVVREGEQRTITGEQIVHDSAGFRIHIMPGGVLTLIDSTISGSMSPVRDQLSAIYNEGELYCSNCLFYALETSHGWGGAYLDRFGAIAAFMNCSFVGCKAVEGGAIAAVGSDIAIINSTFSECTATVTGNQQQGGAAIFSDDGAHVQLVSTTISECSTPNAPEGTALAASRIGAASTSGGDSERVDCRNYDIDDAVVVGNKTKYAARGEQGVSDLIFRFTYGCYIGKYADAGNVLQRRDIQLGSEAIAEVSGAPYLGPIETRMVGPVLQAGYMPLERLRCVGGRVAVSCDIFGDVAHAYAGSVSGAKLQELVDATPSGGVLKVPAGRYDRIHILRPITILAAPGAVIDGKGYLHGIVIESDKVVIDGFTIENCSAQTPYRNCGAGIDVRVDWNSDITVRNVTVRNCKSSGGGGAAYKITLVIGSTFESNHSGDNGGALNDCRWIESCKFFGNGASGAAGAVWYKRDSDKEPHIRSSLFVKNYAGRSGAVDGVYCENCTFYENRIGKDWATGISQLRPSATSDYATLFNCLLYQNELPGKPRLGDSSVTADSQTKKVASNPFYDLSRLNFHLKSNASLASLSAVDTIGKAYDGAWLDLDGDKLVNIAADGEWYYYLGCYAAAPYKIGGLKVTGPDDSYPDTNIRTSLREAVGYARSTPASRSGDGRFHITFADSLFSATGEADLKLDQAQIDITGLAGGVVIDAPADRLVRLSGSGGFRAFRVREDGELWVNNIVFSNCCGSTYGNPPAPADGGAILNYGHTVVSNSAFCGCRAGGSASGGQAGLPVGGGGALANFGLAVIENSSFVDNSAAYGGAVWNGDDGILTLVNSTFWGNTARRGSGGFLSGCGGVLAQQSPAADTLLVNCTLTGNAADTAGGAVYALGGAVGAPTLHLVDTLALGNASGDGNDLVTLGYGELLGTWYGRRNTPTDSSADNWRDASARGGKGPVDVFAAVTEDGTAAVPEVREAGGVPQLALPVAIGVSIDTFWVRHDAAWSNVVYATGRNSADATSVRVLGSVPPRSLDLPLLAADAFGAAYPADGTVPPAGSMLERERRRGLPVPGIDDPLVVKRPGEDALAAAVGYAIANAALLTAEGEEVVISFAGELSGSTVDVSRVIATLPKGAFANAPLVIQGPVTLDAHGACRFFSLGEGNRAIFRDVTFLNGSGDMDLRYGGGAIWGARSELTCERCLFERCTAGTGGAVCLDFSESSGTFIECVFTDNRAERGGDVHCDGRLRFFRSARDDAKISPRLKCEVYHLDSDDPTEQFFSDAFSEVTDALADLREDDILYLLTRDVEGTFDESRLPRGVIVRHRYARWVGDEVVVDGGSDALQSGLDMLAAAEDKRALVIRVEPGIYSGATVPAGLEGLLVYGADLDTCIISGLDLISPRSCLGSLSGLVTVSNLTFSAGYSAGDGGGVSNIAEIVSCAFYDCEAEGHGAAIAGGAVRAHVRTSIFDGCGGEGCEVLARTLAENCTFVGEGGAVADAQSEVYSSLACGLTLAAADRERCSYEMAGGRFEFEGEGDGDYHLRSEYLGRYLTKLRHDWLSPYGERLIMRIAGEDWMVAGAFPVTTPPDQRLQELIDAADPGSTVDVPEGVYGPARVGPEKGALVIRPEVGATVTVDGGGLCPALTLTGDVRVERLLISNGYGRDHDGATVDGGGIAGFADAEGLLPTVRSSVIVSNVAERGGGVANVKVQSCTFATNVATLGSAAYRAELHASVACGADQTVALSPVNTDWVIAERADFADPDACDFHIRAEKQDLFLAYDQDYGNAAYEGRWAGYDGVDLVRKIAGGIMYVAGAFPVNGDDYIQRQIDVATPGDVIVLPSGVFSPFVVPPEKEGITLVHRGSGECCIDGYEALRGAVINASEVTLSGLTFRHCYSEDVGAGVLAAPDAMGLVVSNCVFESNVAEQGGAGIVTYTSALITGVRFVGNTAKAANSTGAALQTADATIAGCLFASNSAAIAGAVFARSTSEIVGSTFFDNVSRDEAYAATASAAVAADATSTVRDSLFFRDSVGVFTVDERSRFVTDDPFIDFAGGDYHLADPDWVAALDIDDTDGMLTRLAALRTLTPEPSMLVKSVGGKSGIFVGGYGPAVGNLQALIDAAASDSEVHVSPGVYIPAVIPADKRNLMLVADGEVTVDGCGRTPCLSVEGFGATVRGFRFVGGNGEDGGAVSNPDESLVLIDCTFAGNTTSGAGGGVAGAAAVIGSRFETNTAVTSGGALTRVRKVVGSLFVGNRVTAAEGHGGAIDATVETVLNCTFGANTAAIAPDCEAEEVRNSLKLADGDVFVDAAAGNYHLRREAILPALVTNASDIAELVEGGYVGADAATLAPLAAGEWPLVTAGCYADWDFTVQSAVDTAEEGATVVLGAGLNLPLFVGGDRTRLTLVGEPGAYIDGGGKLRGILDRSLTLTVANLTVTNAYATSLQGGEDGGGIAALPGKGTVITNVTVVRCGAPGHGGGIYGADYVMGSKLVGNVAGGDGGALADVRYVACSLVYGNIAGGNGGGMRGESPEVLSAAHSVTFASNRAMGEGSGLYGGEDRFSLYWDCSATVTGGRQAAENPFADISRDNFRLTGPVVETLLVDDEVYRAEMAALGAVSPDGEPLCFYIADETAMFAGAYPLDGGNRLQQLIDAASPGDTVKVGKGFYLPITVTVPGITLVATAETAVISGLSHYRAASVGCDNVTLVGFEFANGHVSDDQQGGGVLGYGINTVVSNCTFRNCRAGHGGGSANVSAVFASVYIGCEAGVAGGGSAADGTVCASLFWKNSAVEAGGGVWAEAASRIESCTFVDNRAAAGSALATDAPAVVTNSITCGCSDMTSSSLMVEPDYFLNAAAGRFRPTLDSAMLTPVTDRAYVEAARKWTDPEKKPLVVTVGGEPFMNLGAYSGYDFTLQDRINAAAPGDTIVVEDGFFMPVTVPAGKDGLRIVAAEGKTPVISGMDRLRAATVESPGVVFDGIVFMSGKAGDDAAGGAILGDGTTICSNCVFTASSAGCGGGSSGLGAAVGCLYRGNTAKSGGGSYGDKLVRLCLFEGNRAETEGAALTALAGDVCESCTFATNLPAASAVMTAAGSTNAWSVLWRDRLVGEGVRRGSYETEEDVFVDSARSDYQIRGEAGADFLVTNDEAYIERAFVERWQGIGGGVIVIFDDFIALMESGAFGLATDDTLQARIDAAAPYDEIVLKSGFYRYATVPDSKLGLTIRGVDSGKGLPVVFGNSVTNALIVNASEVSLKNLVFFNGFGEQGGGVDGRLTDDLVISNCYFDTCAAACGGGSAGAALVIHSCYLNCAAERFGGGSYADRQVRMSLFVGNAAGASGGGLFGEGDMKLFNSTFYANSVGEGDHGDKAGAVAEGGTQYGSLYYLNGSTFATSVDSGETAYDPFINAEDGNFRPNSVAIVSETVTDADYIKLVTEENWRDLDRKPLVTVYRGEAMCMRGAYALGYDMLLQELIDAWDGGAPIVAPAGVFGPIAIPAEKQGLTILPPDEGECVVDGGGLSRCAVVEAKDVTLKGLVFVGGDATVGGGVYGASDTELYDCIVSNCHASAVGGAVQRIALASNCVFRCNSAPTGGVCYRDSVNGQSWIDCVFEDNEAMDGYGGALFYDVDSYNVTIDRCRFTGNWASKEGGALATAEDDVELSVRASLFSGNRSLTRGGALALANACTVELSTMADNDAPVAPEIAGGGTTAVSASVIVNAVGAAAATGIKALVQTEITADDIFDDRSGGDFQLKKDLLLGYTVLDEALVTRAYEEAWLDLAHRRYASDEALAFTIGAYNSIAHHLDSGLQRLINEASAGDVIHVPPSVYLPAVVDKPLTLIADNGESGRVIVDGCRRIGCLTVTAPDVKIFGFTFRNGSDVNGGGAEVTGEGRTLFVGCRFEDCAASGYGGGVYGNDIRCYACFFRNNRAAKAGGGAYVSGYGTEMVKCTFVENTLTAPEAGAGVEFHSATPEAGDWPAGNYHFVGSVICHEGALPGGCDLTRGHVSRSYVIRRDDFLDPDKDDWRTTLPTTVTACVDELRTETLLQMYDDRWLNPALQPIVTRTPNGLLALFGAFDREFINPLQQRIDEAEPGSVIELDTREYLPLYINKPGLTIAMKKGEASARIRGARTLRCVRIGPEAAGTVLSGLKFEDGNAPFAQLDGEDEAFGGGVWDESGTAHFNNCDFANCRTGEKISSDPDETPTDVIGFGGAVYFGKELRSEPVPQLFYCSFTNCWASGGGGAVAVSPERSIGRDMSVYRCDFTGNSVSKSKDFEKNEYGCGGAIYGACNIFVSRFVGNRADGGAAVAMPVTRFFNLYIVSTLFARNVARERGGGVYFRNDRNDTSSIAQILNTTFYDNSVDDSAGFSDIDCYCYNGAEALSATVERSIVNHHDKICDSRYILHDKVENKNSIIWQSADDNLFVNASGGDFHLVDAWLGTARIDDEDYIARFRNVTTGAPEVRCDWCGDEMIRRLGGKELMFAGAYTHATSSELQLAIDMTPEGGELAVPDGRYQPVVINKSITLYSESGNASGCVIDGGKTDRCLVINGGDVKVKGITFSRGEAPDGGYGGGVAVIGGQARFSGCRFVECEALAGGGALFGKAEVYNSLFEWNVGTLGAAAAVLADGSAIYNCTFGDNRVHAGENVDVLGISGGTVAVWNSFFHRASVIAMGYVPMQGVGLGSGNETIAPENRNVFVNADAGDWTLRPDRQEGYLIRNTFPGAVDAACYVDPTGRPAMKVLPSGRISLKGAYAFMAEDTIQQLIDQAGDGDTITVPDGRYLPFMVSGKHNLKIVHEGEGEAIIEGYDMVRCVEADSGVSALELDGFVITRGHPTMGDTNHGGGIYAPKPVVALKNCTVDHCHVRVTSSDDRVGGGGAYGVCRVENSHFHDNRVDGDYSNNGGAILVNDSSLASMTIVNSTFTNNYAFVHGGAVASFGSVHVIIEDSEFVRNGVGDEVNGYGGAVRAPGVTCRNSRFIENYTFYFGAVFIEDDDKQNTMDSEIAGCLFARNRGNGYGAAMHISGEYGNHAVVRVRDTTMVDNELSDPCDVWARDISVTGHSSQIACFIDGGVIIRHLSKPLTPGEELYASEYTKVNNANSVSAESIAQDVFVDAKSGDYHLAPANYAAMMIRRSDYYEFFKDYAAHPLDMEGTPKVIDCGGEDMAMLGAYAVNPRNSLQLRIDLASPGDTIETGAGVYVPLTVDSEHEDIRVVATNTSGRAVIDGEGKVRCLSVNAPNVIFENFDFVNGSAEQGGGAAMINEDSLEGKPLTLVNCRFENCHASSLGGGVYNARPILCDFIGNSAVFGGAVAFNDVSKRGYCDACLFVSNQARSGGAMFVMENNTAEVRNATFVDNVLGDWGDGVGFNIYKTGNGSVYLSGSIARNYRGAVGSGFENVTVEVDNDLDGTDDPFLDRAHGDYAIDPRVLIDYLAEDSTYIGSVAGADYIKSLVLTVNDKRVLAKGARPMAVSNALQKMIDAKPDCSTPLVVPDGWYLPVTIPAEKYGLEIEAQRPGAVGIIGLKAAPTVVQQSGLVIYRGLVFVGGYAEEGGAICFSGSGAARAGYAVYDCDFIRNYATASGGAISRPAATDRDYTNLVVNSRFERNFGGSGGAIETCGPARIIRSDFVDNECNGDGGAIVCYFKDGNEVMLENCSFIGNRARNGGGVWASGYGESGSGRSQLAFAVDASLFASNSVGNLYLSLVDDSAAVRNSTFVTPQSGGHLVIRRTSQAAVPRVSGSLFYPSGLPTEGVIYTDVRTFDEDPFVDAEHGDWRLKTAVTPGAMVTDDAYLQEIRAAGLRRIDDDGALVFPYHETFRALAGACSSEFRLDTQTRVNEAASGTTLVLERGDHCGFTVPEGKTLTIVGESPATTRVLSLGDDRCVTVKGTAVIAGLALSNGVATAASYGGALGGGVWGAGATLTNCVITGCRANRGGGAAEVAAVQDVTFAGNVAKYYGGGAYQSEVPAAVMGASFISNRVENARYAGGGLSSGSGQVIGSLFVGNGGGGAGKAIFSSAEDEFRPLEVKNCTFVGHATAVGDTPVYGMLGILSVDGSVFYEPRLEDLPYNANNVYQLDAVKSLLVTNALQASPFVDLGRGDYHLNAAAVAAAKIGKTQYVDEAAAAGWFGADAQPLVREVDGVKVMVMGALAVTEAEPPPGGGDLLAGYRVVSLTGPSVTYPDLDSALAAMQSGDTVAFVDATGSVVAGGGGADATAAMLRRATELAADTPWFTPVATESGIDMVLNEAARPVVDETAEVDFMAAGETVSLVPANVKPNLCYGLGRSDTLGGEYKVAEDGWVRADASGRLPSALNASRLGEGGYYRVEVKK